MEQLYQHIADGLVIGSFYALIASGLSLILGLLGIANIAHGEFVILSAYTFLGLESGLGLPFVLATLVLLVVAVLFGGLILNLVFRPMGLDNPDHTFLGSIGLSLVATNLLLIGVGPEPEKLTLPFRSQVYDVAGVTLSSQRIALVAGTTALFGVLYLVLYRSQFGLRVRALSDDTLAARACGINVARVRVSVFAIGMVLTAAAGLAYGILNPFDPSAGFVPALKALVVVIFGGLGSIHGAIVAGLVLGIAENVAGGYLPQGYSEALAFLLLPALLLVRPSGLFGRPLRVVR